MHLLLTCSLSRVFRSDSCTFSYFLATTQTLRLWPTVSPWWQSPDLWLRPVGSNAPALCQAEGIGPTGLQTQTALLQHTGHGFLLRNPEGIIDSEERGQRKVLLQPWRTDGWKWPAALLCNWIAPNNGPLLQHRLKEIYNCNLWDHSYVGEEAELKGHTLMHTQRFPSKSDIFR